MIVTCYVLTNLTPPGSPSETSFDPNSTRQYMTLQNGKSRFCEKCQEYKCDRSHHCSQCNKCILRMDHHCMWFKNCVGFRNHKFFFLECFYLNLYSICVLYSTFVAITKTFTAEGANISAIYLVFWGFLFAFAVGMSIVMTAFTFYHTSLLIHNLSTLESMSSSWSRYTHSTQPFNVGWYENWCQIMGKSPFLWLLPFPNSIGEGVEYPLNANALPYLPQAEEKNDKLYKSSVPASIAGAEGWSSDEEQYAMKNRRWNPHMGQYEWIEDFLV
ncbi:Palmitoyltransferase pfa3 [Schizosaccharomyces pombe]